MRLGWRAALFALLYPTVLTVAYFVALAQSPTIVQQATYLVGKTIQFGVPLAWWLIVKGRLPRPAAPRRSGLVAGLAFGLLIGGGTEALYHFWLKPAGTLAFAAAALRSKAVGIGVGSPAAFVGLGVFYALFHSLLEEYYWRWFVFGGMRGAPSSDPYSTLVLWRGWLLRQSGGLLTPIQAIVISSIGFALHHVVVLAIYFGWSSWQTWLFSAAVGIGGAVWAVIYARSGSLYAVWLSHALVDASIFVVGYDLLGAH